MSVDYLSTYTLVAIQSALQAGEIIRQGFGTQYEVNEKPGFQNYVTTYDHLSEASIISSLQTHFPSHHILAEEKGSVRSTTPHSPFTWIIDPIDGTTNFTRHIPLFTISIALYHHQEGICGVIYQPMTHELFVAEKGKGAYLNGVPLHVSAVHQIQDSVIAVSFPSSVQQIPILSVNHLMELNQLGATLRNLGSAALALAYLAAGKIDGFWMPHLYPWDLAAGKLLIEEAQGVITSYEIKGSILEFPSSLLASNGKLHQQLLSYITHFLTP